MTLKSRFKFYFPVVLDIETSGLDNQSNCILEIAAQTITKYEGKFSPNKLFHEHVLPFEGAVLDQKAMDFHNIIPDHPFRYAAPEQEAIKKLNEWVYKEMKQAGYHRALLVAHNAHFDHGFVMAAMKRSQIKKPVFHQFTVIDTASLALLTIGESVLARAIQKARIKYDPKEAHSALYDTKITTQLFCHILNHTHYTP